MKYQDNEVIFSFEGGYKIESGSFTVKEYSISSGEDPKHKIHDNLKVNFSGESLEFSIGRHGTTDTAKWFNLQIAPNQTTFNHAADQLNFAMIGNLVFELTGGIFFDRKESFIFDSIVLAQGKSGGNNWWFGGKNCKYIGGNMVECHGKNANGQTIKFKMLRGGNQLNEIRIIEVTLFDLSRWVGNLDQKKKLGDLVMPGSHDAGMSVLRNCSDGSGIIIGPFTKTQSLSIGEQLTVGSRYFDIRIDYDHNALITCHRTDGNGCSGQYLRDVLDETVKFLKDHNSEFAIFKVRFRNFGKNHKEDDIAKMVSDLLQTADYKDYLLKLPNEDANHANNIMDFEIGDLKGKLIVVSSYEPFCNPEKGIMRYFDYSASGIDNKANLTVFDEYSDSDDYITMRNNQVEKWAQYGVIGRKYLFLLSWTLTPKALDYITGLSIKDLAEYANGNLQSTLGEYIDKNKYSKPNIVYVDYINTTVAQSIIIYNQN